MFIEATLDGAVGLALTRLNAARRRSRTSHLKAAASLFFIILTLCSDYGTMNNYFMFLLLDIHS